MRPQPKYVQIAQELLSQISNLPAGTRCPGINQISQQFGVARATAERVLRSLVEKGYVEQIVGSGTFVAERRVHKIAILSGHMDGQDPAPAAADAALRRLSEHIADRLQESNYEIRVFARTAGPGPDAGTAFGFSPDLLVTVGITSNSYLEQIAKARKPIVVVEFTPYSLPVDFVFTAGVRSGYVATRSMLEVGLRQACYVGAHFGAANASVMSLAHSIGFHTAFQDFGLPGPAERIHLLTRPDDLDATLRQLLAQPDRPRAIITADPNIGSKAMDLARQRGLRVPEELAIFAAGGDEPTQVSCMARNHAQIASATANVVWHRLNEPHVSLQDHLVLPKFVDAGTIPPAAGQVVQRMLPQPVQPVVLTRQKAERSGRRPGDNAAT